MKKNLTVLFGVMVTFLIFSDSALCKNWEVKKTRDNLGNVYDVAQILNNEGFIFTVEAGFYNIGTVTIPSAYNAAIEGKDVKFRIDTYDIERKPPQFRSNGKEIDIDLNNEDIKRMTQGQVLKISYYEKGGKIIDIKFGLNGSCIALSRIFDAPRFFSCNDDGGDGLQKDLAKALTRDFKKEGWHDLTFEVLDPNILTIRQAITQQDRLLDGQVVTWIGLLLKPNIVTKLKNAGFNKGIAIDGKSREYPFEISTKYNEEITEAMQKAVRNR